MTPTNQSVFCRRALGLLVLVAVALLGACSGSSTPSPNPIKTPAVELMPLDATPLPTVVVVEVTRVVTVPVTVAVPQTVVVLATPSDQGPEPGEQPLAPAAGEAGAATEAPVGEATPTFPPLRTPSAPGEVTPEPGAMLTETPFAPENPEGASPTPTDPSAPPNSEVTPDAEQPTATATETVVPQESGGTATPTAIASLPTVPTDEEGFLAYLQQNYTLLGADYLEIEGAGLQQSGDLRVLELELNDQSAQLVFGTAPRQIALDYATRLLLDTAAYFQGRPCKIKIYDQHFVSQPDQAMQDDPWTTIGAFSPDQNGYFVEVTYARGQFSGIGELAPVEVRNQK